MSEISVNETLSRVARALKDAPPEPIAKKSRRPATADSRSKPPRRISQRPELIWNLPGFGPMTEIRTSFGDVPAQALRKGDLVKTRAGNYLPIAWLDRIVVSEEFLSRHPDALPVVIRKDSIAKNVPEKDVMLSPRQPIAPEPHRLPDGKRIAATLLGRPGVIRKAEPMITYTLFHLGQPETILCSKLCVRVLPDPILEEDE